jgi:cytochrome c oxidase subunit 2
MPARVRRKLLLLLPLAAVAALATATVAAATNGGFTPQEPHSPNAERITTTYYVILAFTGIIFLVVEGTLVYFIVRYRNRGRARDAEGVQVHGHTRLELIWTVIPVIIIAAIGTFVFYKLPGITGPPATAATPPKIVIDGHQFYWQFIYPNGARSIDVLHLPANRVANFDIVSQDVAHSWWIPQLGGKTDAIPGRTNHTWYQPDTTGTFHGQCAELCGVFHESMLAQTLVEDQQAYDAFVNGGWKQGLGKSEWAGVCAKCHGDEGQGDYGPAINTNPLLVQKAGLTELLRNGRGLMPAVGNNWTEEQIDALIAYMKKSVYKGAGSNGG